MIRPTTPQPPLPAPTGPTPPRPLLKSSSAFNLTQAFKTLTKAPGDVLYGLSKYFNNLASPQFAGNPWQDPDAWYNRIINTVVPDRLEPPKNLEGGNPQTLQTDSATLNLVNSVTKVFIYGASFLVNRANQKKNLAETEDPVHRRLMSLKNRGDMGENLGMFAEKSASPLIWHFVLNGQFGEAAALRAFGLVTSGLAWVSSFVAGGAMIADEAHAFRKKRAESAAGGGKTPIRDAWKHVNVTNLQGAVSRITGALVRVPTQTIAFSTGAFLYARANAPELYSSALGKIAAVSPDTAASLESLLPAPEKVDAHLIYSWLNGAYAVPHHWISAFAVISMIGPLISLVPNLGNFFGGARGFLTAKRYFGNANAPALETYSTDVMKLASLGIASNSFYLASAYLIASPESEAHGVLLSVFGSAFMTAQYLHGERHHLKALREQLTVEAVKKGLATLRDGTVMKFKHALVGWRLKTQVDATDLKFPERDPIERNV